MYQADSAMKLAYVGNKSECGEGPFWNADEQLLYYVDMPSNLIMTYDPVSEKTYSARVETDRSPVTLVVRVKGTKDRYVVGIKGALAVVQWDGRTSQSLTPKYFADLENPKGTTRLNDGKADPKNRLWVGSMGTRLNANPNKFEKDKGNVYLVEETGNFSVKIEKTQLSNGLEWNLQFNKLYFADSVEAKVFKFDYNNEDGSIINRTVLFDLKPHGLVDAMNSLPDGMTIDEEGKLWLCVYGSSKVVRIDPVSGKLLQEINTPEVLQPTSVAFGGKNLDILFVTSARNDWTDDLEAKYPQSGKLMTITGLGVKGLLSRDVALSSSIWNKT